MRDLVFWSSLPFVLPQALAVRRRAPRFASPPGDVAGRVGGDRGVRLLGVGDSVIAGVGASSLQCSLVGQTAEMLAVALGVGVDWTCVGRIGATSDGIARGLVPRLSMPAADFIVVSAGVNDITSMATLARWRRSLAAVLDGLVAHSPQAVIAVAGIPPLQHFPLLPQPLRAVMGLRAASFNRAAPRVLANYPTAAHVPVQFSASADAFAADGFHPSDVSHRALARLVVDAMLRRAMPAAAPAHA